jgi:hypothetical protein
MVGLNRRLINLCLLGAMLSPSVGSWGQNFGSALSLTKKKITLIRKLPPTGHIDGTGVKVVVNGPGIQGDVMTALKSDLEDILLRNDPKLHSEDVHPDTVVVCTVTGYSQPAPAITTQPSMSLNNKKPAPPQYVERVTGLMAVGFKATNARNDRSLAADNVKAGYDHQFNVTNNTNANGGTTSVAGGLFHSMTSSMGHLTKENDAEDKPPTPMELHDKLIQNAAMQIASNLVNTSEQVEVNLARGGGLDEPVKLLENKLWTRALESLETMAQFSTPEEDAYRLYDIGVANEALAYSSEDVSKARTYLQEAAINYGKAIDAKPSEKNFLEPQNRIDTALAHYKALSEQPAMEAHRTEPPAAPLHVAESSHSSGADPPSDALTNDQIIEMVAARMDENNILDTIQHTADVHFDLSVQGQIYLTQHGVNGRVLSAMKTRARGGTSSAHHAAH